MKKEDASNLFLRYLLLVVFGIFLSIFYKVFFPLTFWPVYYLLNLLYTVSLSGNVILISGLGIEIIDACIAGSAYYLLLILNLTTSMKPGKRAYSLLFSFFSLLILNILRIFFLSILFVEKSAFFDFTHRLFWYALSIVFVAVIWFLAVKIFKIKKIPAYSDLKALPN
jgi:exosortase/archaeosortase family protein